MLTNLVITAVLTAYCHCAKCCGHANRRTASGITPQPGVTVAAPRQVPFGTRVYIPYVGWRTAQDRLARRYDTRWDVFMPTHAQAKRFGIRTNTIILLNK